MNFRTWLANKVAPKGQAVVDTPIVSPADLESFAIGILGGNTASGVAVTPDTAMRVSTVYACVRVLSQSVAQLPIHLYRHDGKKRIKAVDHPLYDVLHFSPNAWQTSYEWRQMMQTHLCHRGNAYSQITRSGNRVIELIPIHPDRVTAKQHADLSITYQISKKNGGTVELYGGQGGDILHLRGLVTRGITGLSPISAARDAIGLSLSTEMYGNKLFKNGTRIGGIFKHPKLLTDESHKRLIDSMNENYSGIENAHKSIILEEGMDFQPVAMSSDDAQFIETRKMQRSEIAAFYGVPPHKVGDLEHATFSNIENQALEFVTDSLLPWLVNWEQALARDLLSPADRKKYFVKMKVDAILRGDIKSRSEALNIQRRAGVINANEWRALEDMDPREDAGGDEYIVEQNMTAQNGGIPPKTPTKQGN